VESSATASGTEVPSCACAGLSLRGHADAAGFVAAFTGSHRRGWITWPRKCSSGRTGKCALFLLETSVLERLSGGLCDAVTGGEGSQALLEEAERAGLFLVPFDEVRGWWRCHRLFAGLLRARLQQNSLAGRRSCTAMPRPGARSMRWRARAELG
jgi:LuxR family maltose regulon positive regulatory protein